MKSLRHLTCAADGCDGQHYVKGYCVMHYKRLRAKGHVGDPSPRPTLAAWLDEHVTGTDSCIEWDGAVATRGYGKSGRAYVHRASYERFVGPIPEGLTIDHLCRNKLCCNPRHLEAVTPEENHRRWVETIPAVCLRGHPVNAENTYYRKDNGRRQCNTCRRERRAARRAAGIPRALVDRSLGGAA